MKTILKPTLLTTAVILLCVTLTSWNSNPPKADTWEPLLDLELSKWDAFVGAPHHTVAIEGYEKGNGMDEGTPLGLNNDPLNVFTTVELDGEPVLKVSGEIYGAVTSKKEYENYHLSLMFKWGEKKYEPRLDKPMDSGVLYHAIGEEGAFWNCWMQSQEFQIQEEDCGDYYTIAGTGADIRALKKENPDSDWDIFIYNPDSDYKQFKTGEDGRCRKSENYGKLEGWNQIDLVCLGDKAYHIVNGKVVLVMENSVTYNENDVAKPLTKGKIQLQSEGAEIYYKDIKIRSVNALPTEFAKQL
ncbi:3-keto-disaccharide hydrolase [Formosa sp. 3Alg 14/1]|uniref:3-keto-disaccharide hydrolase n=1 Tax=Formosa sp. 3Alg 14/1 TaxID=3382190 RepID=UPI0039BEBE61